MVPAFAGCFALPLHGCLKVAIGFGPNAHFVASACHPTPLPPMTSSYAGAADPAIRGFVSFYAGRVEACHVAGERVEPQDGDFYGGWVLSWVSGPFKGGPGTRGW